MGGTLIAGVTREPLGLRLRAGSQLALEQASRQGSPTVSLTKNVLVISGGTPLTNRPNRPRNWVSSEIVIIDTPLRTMFRECVCGRPRTTVAINLLVPCRAIGPPFQGLYSHTYFLYQRSNGTWGIDIDLANELHKGASDRGWLIVFLNNPDNRKTKVCCPRCNGTVGTLGSLKITGRVKL